MVKVFEKRGQVWVETVIYTLIAFVLIGLVLGFARPKIQEMQDRAIIEQTIQMLEDLDTRIISAVRGGPGNQRIIDVSLKKGELTIDSNENKIIFELDTTAKYSQEGLNVTIGGIITRTENKGKFNKVYLIKDYNSSYNLLYDGEKGVKTLGKTQTPYKMLFSNLGNKIITDEECTNVNGCTTYSDDDEFVANCVEDDSEHCEYESKREIINIKLN